MSEQPARPRLVWDGRSLPLEVLGGPDALQGAILLNMLNCNFELHHYRGFTSLSGLDRTDHDYAICVKRGSFAAPGAFIRHESPNGGEGTEMFDASLPSRKVALDRFREFVDRFYEGGPSSA